MNQITRATPVKKDANTCPKCWEVFTDKKTITFKKKKRSFKSYFAIFLGLVFILAPIILWTLIFITLLVKL